MIVLDTSILSEAFRRRTGKKPSPAAETLSDLVRRNEPFAVPGIVLQELLSGVRSDEQFRRLLALTRGLRVFTASREHHVSAANIANLGRRAGVAGATVDCLIAAQTNAIQGELFTSDRDFRRIAPLCGLRLFDSEV